MPIDQGDEVTAGAGALDPAQNGRDLLERAADMEQRYRTRLKAQRDRLETMQHRLLELLSVIAECRQTIDEDWLDKDDDDPTLTVETAYELLENVERLLRTGVSSDKRAALDHSDEAHAKMAQHLVEGHRLDQVYADLTAPQMVEIHDRMRHDDHRHTRNVVDDL